MNQDNDIPTKGVGRPGVRAFVREHQPNMTFDPELKIWNAQSEADFDGWKLEYVESLPVDRDEQSFNVTVERGRDERKVYVARELGKVMHAKFIQGLEAEWVESVNREAWRERFEH
jgi:hypothetical protein